MSCWPRFVVALAVGSAGLVAGPPAWAAQTPPGDAATAEELARLREALDTLRQEYGERIAAIEARLAALGAPTDDATTQLQASASSSPTATTPGTPQPSSKLFNPDVAVIGDFIGAVGRSPGGGEPALEMHESELSFQAVVDPYARADFFLTVGPDEVGVEEAFVTFPALPGGLLLKAGKMRDAFGKVNALHNHTLPFVDRPLMTTNLLGGEEALADSGISLARLVPNPWLFLEATGQVFRGDSAIFRSEKRADLAYVGHLRAFQDITESTNLDLGGSIAYGPNDAGPSFTTRLLGVDATLRYRPLRRSIYTHLLARAELAWSRRQQPGDAMDADGGFAGASGDVHALGGYAYLEYQFARRWLAGVRYDDAERATVPGRDRGGSLILTYRPSEFSLLRAQLRHTRFAEDRTANELLFQLVFAIGAHGAHPF